MAQSLHPRALVNDGINTVSLQGIKNTFKILKASSYGVRNFAHYPNKSFIDQEEWQYTNGNGNSTWVEAGWTAGYVSSYRGADDLLIHRAILG